ncbi:MAG: hypothetical protein IJ769_01150 [Clostridia bacterium]|nr:hypothetical protein [Clostridia bacterium]
MGVISILLGFISFFLFTGAGAILANALIEGKAVLALSFSSLESISNTSLMIGVVGFFAFIGLLIGMNLIMHGLTYNKIAKIQTYLRRRG